MCLTAVLLAVSTFIGLQKSTEAQGAMAAAEAKLQARKNAVLVFGATGKLGKEVVAQVQSSPASNNPAFCSRPPLATLAYLPLPQVLESNRTVVAAVRSGDKASDLLPKSERLVVKTGIDVSNPSTFPEDLWEGVTQVVSAVGPTFSRTEEGPKYAPKLVISSGSGAAAVASIQPARVVVAEAPVQ